MKRLKVSAVISGLQQLLDNNFLKAEGHTWLWLIMGMNMVAFYMLAHEHAFLGGMARLFIAVLMIAVVINTHRYLLLDERPGLRFGETEWRYILAALGLYLPVILVAILFGSAAAALVTFSDGGGIGVAVVMGVIAFAVLVWMTIRFIWPMSLVLPARAIGRNDFRYGDGLAAAQHNIWQLAGVTILAVLIVIAAAIPAGIVLAIMGAVRPEDGMNMAQVLIAGIVNGGVDYFGAIVGAGVLSLTYAGLVEGDTRYAEDVT